MGSQKRTNCGKIKELHSLTKSFFRQINSLIIYLVCKCIAFTFTKFPWKNFCQIYILVKNLTMNWFDEKNCVAVYFSFFYTVSQCDSKSLCTRFIHRRSSRCGKTAAAHQYFGKEKKIQRIKKNFKKLRFFFSILTEKWPL